ncbi:DUF397 domain-containing protein [Actinoallomurus iriomotensis]
MSTPAETCGPVWRKSSRSGSQAQSDCVEVASGMREDLNAQA